MISLIKRLLVLLALAFAIITCTNPQDGNKREKRVAKSNKELTQEQQSAFDALNKLQISTDERDRLYSTFPNIEQPCYPADTSFEVSQSELLLFMEKFISKHCQNLTTEDQKQLTKSSVLAQEKYTILHCVGNESNANYEKGLPMTGTWIMPNVLGRRDIILVW